MSGFSTFNRLRLPIDAPARAARPQAARPTCRVCAHRASKYTCPRCHVPYCSAACFRTHGEACTEAFYRRHIEDEMVVSSGEGGGWGNGGVVDDATLRRRVLDMVQRTAENDQGGAFGAAGGGAGGAAAAHGYEEEEQEEEQDDGLDNDRDALVQLAELEDLTLEDLTPEQRKAFLRAVADGQVSSDIDPWTPWWVELRGVPSERHNHSASRPTITSVGSDEPAIVSAYSPASPTPAVKRAPVTGSTKKNATATPAPTLKFNLISVLFSFVETWRHFNGEALRVDPLQAARELVDGSAVLSDDRRYASTEESVLSSVEAWTRRQSCNAVGRGGGMGGVGDAGELSLDLFVALLGDVRDIVSGGQCCIVEALTETKMVLEMAVHELSSDPTTAAGADKVAQRKRHKEAKRRLRRVGKKVDFFIVWARRQASHARHLLCRELEVELDKLRDRARLLREGSAVRSEGRKRKDLVVVRGGGGGGRRGGVEEEKRRAGPLIEEL